MEGLSIVIPTYNSCSTLGNCLDSIKRQTRQCGDIVVVDRYSTDRTVPIAKAHGASIIQSSARRSAARNLGARASDSFGVLFVDSDMILLPTLVGECEDLLRQYDSLIVPEASIGSGFWATCKRLERENYLGNMLVEAPRCFRRESLLAIGGYDENLEAGEDWELRQRSVRKGLKLNRTRAMILHDEGEYSLPTAFKRKYMYGKTMRRYLNRNPSASLIQVNPIIRVMDPGVRIMSYDLRHGLGVVILRGIEFAGAAAGVVAGRIRAPTEDFGRDSTDRYGVVEKELSSDSKPAAWLSAT